MSLSIIIPVFNEVQYLKTFTNNLIKSFSGDEFELIFVNDGSTDGSTEWIEDFVKNSSNNRIRFISLPNNMGKGYAIREGIKKATKDFCLFQDADLELDVHDSYEMYQLISKNKKMNVLFGSRFLSGKLKKNENLINEIVVKLNSLLFNILFFQSISDLHCGSKIVKRDILNNLKLTINDFGFEIDIATQLVKNNCQLYEYGVSYFSRNRAEGKKITWIDGVKSYYYLFKTRFIDNDVSVLLSIIYSSGYMTYIGSYFGLGIGKILMMILLWIVGCIIGLSSRLTSSSVIFLFCYFGSLFSKGNGRIYTVLITFFVGLYLSKKISLFINKNTSNKLIKFFV